MACVQEKPLCPGHVYTATMTHGSSHSPSNCFYPCCMMQAGFIDFFDNKSSKVFVSRLHPRTTEDALTKHFEECGPVRKVLLRRDPRTNTHLGYAQVEFHSITGATSALGVSLRARYAFVCELWVIFVLRIPHPDLRWASRTIVVSLLRCATCH
jgi:RNA recognition motif-containing protein